MDIQVQQELERINLYKKCDEHVELYVINLGFFGEMSVFDNLIHRTMSKVEIYRTYTMDIMANKIWERLSASLSF